MTADELEALVLEAKDPWDLQRALADADERQRAKLSAPAQKLFAQLTKNEAGAGASDRLKRFLGKRGGDVWKHWNSPANNYAKLALFAVGPLSAVKKRDAHVWHEDHEILARIMADRRPEWIDDWIDFELGQEFTTLDFPLLRSWIKQGVCRKPEADGYYRLFASHLMRTGFYNRRESVPPLSRQLLDDPELLNDVEGIFRVETIAFNTNSWLQKGAADHYESWPQALVKLSGGGHLDRERLLQQALAGLRLDLKQNQLSGFHKFYGLMEPTADELRSHQPDYVGLLCHPVSHVAKFAIDMLAKLEKQGVLDDQPVLLELRSVFASEAKSNAIAALKLVGRIIARGKGAHSPLALDTLCEALRHANTDVQANALALLEANSAQLQDEQRELLRELEGFVSASNRNRLAGLLANIPGAPADERQTGPMPASLPQAPPRQSAGPDYTPISGVFGELPVLSDANRISPIDTLDELIGRVLHALEVVESPDEIERIVDGISRLADQRPADFDKRVAPLLHRLRNASTAANGLAAAGMGPGLAVLDLIERWAEGGSYRLRDLLTRGSVHDVFFPMVTHLRAVGDRVARQQSQPLLCAPTHKGGWIDPTVWVERLRAVEHMNVIAESMDLRLSLLRLAPDNRAEALAQSRSLGRPLQRIADFALGGDERPGRADRKNYAAWISAARARSPLEDWSDEFGALELEDTWPDGLRPARYRWRSSHTAGQYGDLRWKTPELTLSVTCDGSETDQQRPEGLLNRFVKTLGVRSVADWRELPSAASCRLPQAKHYWAAELGIAWITHWLSYVWPQNPAGAFMVGASRLTERLDGDSSNWTPGFGYFLALFEKNRPWGEAGHLLLALGLVGKDADAKGLAVDALIEGIEGRQFDPQIFARTMAELSQGGWVKFNRLAQGLLQAVQVSPTHARVIAVALQAWLPRLDFGQRNAFHVLEVLVEAQAASQQPLEQAARDALDKIAGSGKAAKLAKQLQRA